LHKILSMRPKIILLILCASICLISCKKEKLPAPDQLAAIKQQIIGTWLKRDGKSVAYDQTGKEVKSTGELMFADLDWEFTDSSQVNNLYFHKSSAYTLVKTDGKVILTFDDKSNEVSINNNIMTWINITWINKDDFFYHPGYKLIYTSHLKRIN
jgi:hypothetical protein